MPDKYYKPCLDSSFFLGGLNHEICNGIKREVVFRHIWQEAKDGKFEGVFISALTLAEVYKRRPRLMPAAAVLDEFLAHIDEPFVEVIEIDRETALKAHALCRQYAENRLLPSDALQLACALRASCDALLAWDGPLVGIHHDDIRIEEPCIIDRTLLT